MVPRSKRNKSMDAAEDRSLRSSMTWILPNELDSLGWPRFDRTFVRHGVTVERRGMLVNLEGRIDFAGNSLPDGAWSIIYHWHNFHTVFDGLRNVEDGQRHSAWDEYGCVSKIQTRTDSSAKSKCNRPRILLRLLAIRCDISLGIELRRIGIGARVTQHLPG